MTKENPKGNGKDATDDPMEEPSQEERIGRLEERIDKATDGAMTFTDTDEEMDPDLKEAFLENVAMIEEAGWTVPMDQLLEGGFKIVPPDELDDEEIGGKLRELILAMSLRNMFVDSTDHLSDRELYTHLVEHSLREESFMGPPKPVKGFNFVIDILGSGSDEDIDLDFKYYKHDEESRQRWMESFPDYEMPDPEDPPYDRDRFLPQPDFSVPMDFDPFDDEDDEPVM